MTHISRSLDMLDPAMRPKVDCWLKKCQERGLKIMVTCTARTMNVQLALWAQGRKDLSIVNALRKKVDLAAITEAQNRKVTNTLRSKHIIDDQHNYANALDFAVVNGTRPTWDLKADVNENNIEDYKEASLLAVECGLISGASFPERDYAHLEDVA